MTSVRDLAGSTGGSQGGFAAEARRQARQILSGSQYQTRPERSFRPLAGVLAAIGRFFDRVFGPLWRFLDDHLFHPVGNSVFDLFGDWWPLLVLALALVAGIALGRIIIKRRALPARRLPGQSSRPASQDPETLERLADQAELDGDLEVAVRLRFRAGVIRLERMGAVDRGPTRTDRELSGSLRSATFDALAADLESIVYGGAPATEQQAADALSGWRRVAVEVERDAEVRRRARPQDPDEFRQHRKRT